MREKNVFIISKTTIEFKEVEINLIFFYNIDHTY